MRGAAAFVARTQLRRRWLAVVVLALVAGMVGGVACSLIAGSRRSGSVVDRYFAAGLPYDLTVMAPSLEAKDLLAIKGVERSDLEAYVAGVFRTPDGGFGGGVNGLAIEFDSIDPTFKVLDGKLPPAGDSSSVLVNQIFARQFDVGAGDTVKIQMFAPEQAQDVNDGRYLDPRGPTYPFKVAAVVRLPPDVAIDKPESPDPASSSDNSMAIPAQFYREHQNEFLNFGNTFDIQLDHSATSRKSFVAAVDTLTRGADQPLYGPPRFATRRDTVRTPVAVETSTLLALGLALAAIGAVAVGLLLRSEQSRHDADVTTLRTIGFRRSQLAVVAALRTVPVACLAALIGTLVAILLSDRFPIGVGRQIELDPGVDVNVAVVALGAVAIAVVVVAFGVVFGIRGGERVHAHSKRGTLAQGLAQVGAPTSAALGANLAFTRQSGRRSLPVRSAVAAGALALAVVVGLAMFVASIDQLANDRARHGWAWDVAIGNINFPFDATTLTRLEKDPLIAQSSAARYGQASVDGRATEILALDGRGEVQPEVVSGRAPVATTEIALGARTMRGLGLHVGDTVNFSVANGEFAGDEQPTDQRLTVVGVVVGTPFGEADLGEVGVVTLDAIANAGGNTQPQLLLAELHGNHEAAIRAFTRNFSQELMTDLTPARIVNLTQVRALPMLGILFAGALGTIVLGYVLAISIRNRARDLAVLRALGLTSRRVGHVLAWQGIVLAVAMLVAGLPLGILVGTSLWRTIAHGLGVVATPTLTPLLLLVVPGALAVAVLASRLPARRARRRHVAVALRAE